MKYVPIKNDSRLIQTRESTAKMVRIVGGTPALCDPSSWTSGSCLDTSSGAALTEVKSATHIPASILIATVGAWMVFRTERNRTMARDTWCNEEKVTSPVLAAVGQLSCFQPDERVNLLLHQPNTCFAKANSISASPRVPDLSDGEAQTPKLGAERANLCGHDSGWRSSSRKDETESATCTRIDYPAVPVALGG